MIILNELPERISRTISFILFKVLCVLLLCFEVQNEPFKSNLFTSKENIFQERKINKVETIRLFLFMYLL